jgi:O-antigen ligase
MCFGYYIYKTKPTFHLVAISLSIALFYSSFIAIVQFFLQHSVGGVLWFLGERSFTVMTPGIARMNWCWFSQSHCFELLRPYGTFPHPNVLGGFVALTLYIMLFALQFEKIKRIRLWFYGVFCISVLALLITFSRSAWIAGTLAVVLFFLQKKQNKKVLLSVGIGLLFCSIFALPYLFTLMPGNESIDIRYSLASVALTLFSKHPLFGTGLGTFLISLPSVAVTRDLFFIQPVHNIFLLWTTETGLIGILFILTAIKKYARWLAVHKVPILQYIPLVVLLLIGLVDHYPLSLQQGQLMLTLCIARPFLNFRNS